jgi:DNA-directed RNA polymerase beta subunit
MPEPVLPNQPLSILSPKPQSSAILRPLQPPAQEPDEVDDSYRDFDDMVATRQAIFDRTLQAAKNIQPVSNSRHTLRLKDVDYIDDADYDYKTQKQAIIGGKTLGRRLAGTWELLDNKTNQVLDAKKMTVARVPYMTDRGTVIYNGVEYTISNQLRLRPGIFTRTKENGEIESHANFLPGEGVSHRYFLNPEKSTFHVRLQQSMVPLMPMLRVLGATDKELREAWGDEIYAANLATDSSAIVNKLYDKLVGASKRKPGENVNEAVANVIRNMRLDPDVMKSTLGKPYKNLDKDTIIDITKKLVGVSRGEQDVDDRDNLAYQTIHGPEDLFSERLEKDYGRLRRELLGRATFTGNLKHINAGALTKQLDSVILNSGLAQPLEEVNPAEILDRVTRITKMGEGGLNSLDSVPDESRMVQSSHAFFIDPIRTPESERVGIDLHLASALRKGKNGRVSAPFYDLSKGKVVYRSSQDLAGTVVTTPDQMSRRTKRIYGMKNGQLDIYPKSEVRYVFEDFNKAFSPLALFVPGMGKMKAQRVAMGSRMSTQALGLVKGEAPLVQYGMADNPEKSYEDHYGSKLGAVRAQKHGKVISVSPDEMLVEYYEPGTGNAEKAKIPLYNNFVLNRKSGLHNTPLVQPGDSFKPGALLARSNFTDDNGTAALGANVRVAYMADKGYNFEDAIRISESLAKRLTSEHMYQHAIEYDDKTKWKKKEFVSLFPSAFKREQLDNIDNDGVIKPGTQVNYGDPLILGAKERETAYGKIHRKGKAIYSNSAETWEHSNPGIVTDVFKSDKGVNVVVKSTSEMKVGDKLAFRYGDKSVVSGIVPDDQMPVAADGKPVEILANPLSIISRGNPIQMLELALGKIAEKTGKPYKIPEFASDDDAVEYGLSELKKHGLSDLEDVTDPETGRTIKDIAVGNRFVMKLSHMAEDKLQGRAFGSYTQDEVPAKGGPEGSKQVGLLLMNALLSHGAVENIYDASVVRGQKNPDMWLAFMNGQPMPAPDVPHVYQKFVNQLRGAGINVVEDGSTTNIMAMTNDDVKQYAGDRYLKNGETLDFGKNQSPAPGGLFDPSLTGGPGGNRWSAIKLHEPMPNPVMEEPIRRLLGLTQKQFDAVLSGKEKLANGLTGPSGLQKALASINIKRELENARDDIDSGKKGKRDSAVRRLKYLKAADRLGIHPKDWMLDAVPVLPPMFRPVTMMQGGDGMPLVSDANYLYKELLEANDNLSTASELVDDVGEERLAVYKAFQAVTGLGDPIHPKLQEKKVKGLLAHIFGNSPKTGTVQRRLIGTAVDMVGRGVITPNPDFDMDTVGLPEEAAWNVFKVAVARRLRRRGMKLGDAMRQVEDRTDLARKELLAELDVHPIIIDRAPAWHKFSTMAFMPRLVQNDTLQISPLVVKGFGADFDGDAMQFHVPAGERAIKEALEKLMPSKNLISAADFKTPMHMPGQEYVGGLYAASTKKSKLRKRVFANLQAAKEAAAKGLLGVDDEIDLLT